MTPTEPIVLTFYKMNVTRICKQIYKILTNCMCNLKLHFAGSQIEMANCSKNLIIQCFIQAHISFVKNTDRNSSFRRFRIYEQYLLENITLILSTYINILYTHIAFQTGEQQKVSQHNLLGIRFGAFLRHKVLEQLLSCMRCFLFVFRIHTRICSFIPIKL